MKVLTLLLLIASVSTCIVAKGSSGGGARSSGYSGRSIGSLSYGGRSYSKVVSRQYTYGSSRYSYVSAYPWVFWIIIVDSPHLSKNYAGTPTCTLDQLNTSTICMMNCQQNYTKLASVDIGWNSTNSTYCFNLISNILKQADTCMNVNDCNTTDLDLAFIKWGDNINSTLYTRCNITFNNVLLSVSTAPYPVCFIGSVTFLLFVWGVLL